MAKPMKPRRRSSEEVRKQEQKDNVEATLAEAAEAEESEAPDNGVGGNGVDNRPPEDDEEDDSIYQQGEEDPSVDFDNPPEPASARAERKLVEMMEQYADRLRYQIGGKHFVHLYRDKPVEDEHGNTLSGYVCKTQERIDIDWISERYGGGVYHVTVWGPGKNKLGRQINKNLSSVWAIEISGPPKITLKDHHFQGEEGVERFQKTVAKIEANKRLQEGQRYADDYDSEEEVEDEEEDEVEEERHSRRRRRDGWDMDFSRRSQADPFGQRLLDEQMDRSKEDRLRAQQLEDELRRNNGGMGKEEFRELLQEVQNGNKSALGQIRGMVETFVKAQKEKGDDKPFEMLVEVLREKDSKPKDDSEAKRLEGLLQVEKESRKELIDTHKAELERRDKQHAAEMERRDKQHEAELREIRDELATARREAENARSAALDKASDLIGKKEEAFAEEKAKLLDQLKEERERHERELRTEKARAERDLENERKRTQDEKERSERELKAEKERAERDLAEERRRTQDEKERAEREYKDQRERYEDRIKTLKEQHEAFIKTAEKGSEGITGALKQQIQQLESKVEELSKELDQKREDLQNERLKVVETKQEVATAKLEAKVAANDLGSFSGTVEKITGLSSLLGFKKLGEGSDTPSEPESTGVTGVIKAGMETAREAIQSEEVRGLVAAVASRLKAGQQDQGQTSPGMPPQQQPGGQMLYQQAWIAAQQEMAKQREAQAQMHPQPMPAAPPRPQMPAAPPAPGGGMSEAELDMLARALANDEPTAPQPQPQHAPPPPPLGNEIATNVTPPSAPPAGGGDMNQAAAQALVDMVEEAAEVGAPVEQTAEMLIGQFGFTIAEARMFLGDQTSEQLMNMMGIQPGMASLAAQDYFERALDYVRNG